MNRILIVDEHPENLHRLRAWLTSHGCVVDEAHDGVEALFKARQSPPDLVIADWRPPELAGDTLLRAWKADARLKPVPFVVCSASDPGPEEQKRMLDLGADAFISQPAEPETFMARVLEVLAQRPRGGAGSGLRPTDEDELLRNEYSAILFRKIEQKSLQLEQTTRDLAATEAHLRAIFETEPDCVKLLAADGSLLEMNRAGLRMLEADSFEQVENQSVYPLVVEKYRAEFCALTARVFQGASGMMEFESVGLKGGRHWLETHASPLRDADGAVTALLGITRDITARKRAEAIVACRSEVLQLIATGAPLAATLATLLRHMEAFAPGMLCSVLLLDDSGQIVRHGAAPSLPDAFNRAIDGQPIGPQAGSCGTAAFRREPVIVEDIATDPLWADYRELARTHGLRACWSTPIFDEHQSVLGTFAIYYRQPGRPTALHQRCIDLATNLASIAINRQRTESALRASESRLRRLVESNIIGVIVADTDGRILEANDCFLNMVGYTRAEVNSGTLRWDAMTPPEWRPVDEALRAALVRTGCGGPVEKEYLHKDGYRVPILATVARLEGSPGTAICLIENITERKRAELAIQKYETIFLKAGWGMAIADPETHNFIQVNPAFARMHGYAVEEMISLNLTAMLTAEARAEIPKHAQAARDKGHHLYESMHVRKDGSCFPCLADVTAFKDATGRVIFRAATFEDITERKQAEEKIQAQLGELLRWQQVTLGRENRVMELKREVNELHRRLGEPARYPSQATA